MYDEARKVAIERDQTLPLMSDADIVQARQTVRRWSEELRFNLVEQTKMVTAASELARNTLLHGGGGFMRLEVVATDGGRRGLRLVFHDRGPGIPNVTLAMQDGFTTGNGLGLGLGGARRLVSEFDIESLPGEGTRVTIVRWR